MSASVKLANAQLINQNLNTHEPQSTGSSTVSIGVSVLIFVLLVAGIAIIAYILNLPAVSIYPISPFNFGDTITIRPAVLTYDAFTTLSPPGVPGGTPANQYLTYNPNFTNLVNQCNYPGYPYGTNAQAATFTGDPNSPNSQWVLQEFSTHYGSPTGYDAKQSTVYGFGNRFFLQNNSNPLNPALRLRYQVLNERVQGLCYNTIPLVIGSDGSDGYFETDFLVYFLPTAFPNLYYMLFPSCSTWDVPSAPGPYGDNTTHTNDGIISIRPFSDNCSQSGSTSNRNNNIDSCTQCNDLSGIGNFNPYVNGNYYINNDPTQGLSGFYPNVAITNLLDSTNLLPPYIGFQSSAILFEVKKV